MTVGRYRTLKRSDEPLIFPDFKYLSRRLGVLPSAFRYRLHGLQPATPLWATGQAGSGEGAGRKAQDRKEFFVFVSRAVGDFSNIRNGIDDREVKYWREIQIRNVHQAGKTAYSAFWRWGMPWSQIDALWWAFCLTKWNKVRWEVTGWDGTG